MRLDIRILSVLLICLALAGCSGSPTESAKSETYSFLDNFASGIITPASDPSTPTGKPALILKDFEVGGEKRQAMITLASAKIVFDVAQVDKDAKLKFGAGMNTKIGDGAEGVITVEADGTAEVVYRKFLDPVDNTADKRWFDESVDLAKYAGKHIKISFETKPGPKGDAIGDWFAWSDPEITR